MAFHIARVSTVEYISTGSLAFGDAVPLLWVLNTVYLLRMSRTTNAKCWSDLVSRIQVFNDGMPHIDVAHQGGIANDVKAISCSTAANVDTIRSFEETHVSLEIASNRTENDYFGFFSLEVVDRRQFKHAANFDICYHA